MTEQITAPWPIVGECHAGHRPDHSCAQCDGSHEHTWVAWHEAPSQVTAGPGVPVRCRVCGARKCDLPSCFLRRHHRGDHEHY